MATPSPPLRLAIVGRTKWLLDAASAAHAAGHVIAVVITAKETAEAEADAAAFEAFAGHLGARFFRTVHASRADVLAALAAAGVDACLTMNFPGIFDAAFTACFAKGVWNCHGSLLPKYRGNACPNWAILNGEAETGLSIHAVVADQLDSGDVLLQRRFDLTGGADIGDVYAWYGDAIPAAFAETCALLARGSIAPIQQNESAASFGYPRRPEDSRLDFNRDAAYLARLVRASTRPFSGAFCFLDGGPKVTVWRAALLPARPRVYAARGQILAVDAEGRIEIAAADGVLRLDRYDGIAAADATRRKRMTAFPA
jgi:methionyl-tRNA formyltransferase